MTGGTWCPGIRCDRGDLVSWRGPGVLVLGVTGEDLVSWYWGLLLLRYTLTEVPMGMGSPGPPGAVPGHSILELGLFNPRLYWRRFGWVFLSCVISLILRKVYCFLKIHHRLDCQQKCEVIL